MSVISYDLKTAAAVTGLSQSHLKRMIGDGSLAGKRSHVNEDTGELDGKWLILATSLAEYINSLPDA